MSRKIFSQYVAALLLCILGLFISGWLFVRIHDEHTAVYVRPEFERRALALANALIHEIRDHLSALENLRSFFEAFHGQITRQQFHVFVQPFLMSHPDIRAIEWIPQVLAEQRELFEKQAQEEGFTFFRLTERQASGEFIPVQPREEYFPVYFVEPYQGNEAALGFDLASESVRRAVLARARKTGQIAVSARLHLVQGTGKQYSVLLCQPVYRHGLPHDNAAERQAHILGFLLMVLPLNDVLHEGRQGIDTTGLAFTLLDTSAPADEQLLYGASTASSSLRWKTHFRMGDRTWRLEFFLLPETATWLPSASLRAWRVFLSGVSLTMLCTGYLLTVARYSTRIKQSEAALRISEERYRVISELASDYAVGIRVEPDGQFIPEWITEAFTRLTGFTLDDLRHSPSWHTLIHPDDAPILPQLKQRLLAGEKVIYEIRLLTKNGDVRWVNTISQPVWDMTRQRLTHIYSTSKDITEQKKAELKLLQLNAELEAVLNAFPDLYFRFNADGLIVDYRAPQTELLYTSPETFLGKSMQDVLPAKVSEVIAEAWQRARSTMHQVTVEYWLSVPTGRRYFEARFVPFTEHDVLVIVRDLTERKQAEQALQDSEARLHAIITSAMDAIITINSDQRITLFNAAAERMFGCPAAEALGDGIERFIPERFHLAHRQHIQHFASTRITNRSMAALGAIYGLRSNGEEFPLEASISQIEIAGQKLFTVILRDVTQRQKAEHMLREMNEVLEQRVRERTIALSAANTELAKAARLKDEFLASMSHELRTPLHAILGLSEALQEEVYGNVTDKQRLSLSRIEESGRHLLSLINDILDLSKIEAGKITLQFDDIEVEAICQASLRFIKEAADTKHLSVTLSLDPAVTTLQADNRRLKQMLVNLLSNAVKFTRDGGAIGLEVAGHATEGQVVFTVWDTGIGIAEADMARLFQPFVQLDSALNRQHQGTGLGLSLVARLAELHQGSVAVESAVGAGSRFRLTLPWTLPQTTEGCSAVSGGEPMRI